MYCTSLNLNESEIKGTQKNAQGGYSSCWETLPVVEAGRRTETAIKRRKMERKFEALLRKCERETIKYIKAHRDQICALGKLLYEKKHLKSSEILSCIG